MRITARTFGQLISNSTLVFANTGLALALVPFSADANAAVISDGTGDIAREIPEVDVELNRSLYRSGEEPSRPALPCAHAGAVTGPEKANAAITRVTHRGNSVTLWDGVMPPATPAPIPLPAPVPESLPVPVEVVPDSSGAAKTCASS